MKGLLFISHQTEQFTYLQSIEIALQGGCRQVQLRMKEASADDILNTALIAKEMCNTYNAQLYIDDCVQICQKIQARGVHLGKLDMPPNEARKILGEDFIIGGTANTFGDTKRLYNEGVNYIGLGPFRFTTTKKNLSPILGLNGYQSIIRQCQEHNINLPIVAIGGITIGDIPDIMNTGVAAIALSSSILSAANPIEETRKIINLINTYQQ